MSSICDGMGRHDVVSAFLREPLGRFRGHEFKQTQTSFEHDAASRVGGRRGRRDERRSRAMRTGGIKPSRKPGGGASGLVIVAQSGSRLGHGCGLLCGELLRGRVLRRLLRRLRCVWRVRRVLRREPRGESGSSADRHGCGLLRGELLRGRLLRRL